MRHLASMSLKHQAISALSQYKICLSRHGDFYKVVLRPSYLYNVNPYTGKTTFYIETDTSDLFY